VQPKTFKPRTSTPSPPIQQNAPTQPPCCHACTLPATHSSQHSSKLLQMLFLHQQKSRHPAAGCPPGTAIT
jgi:hypothetical protein